MGDMTSPGIPELLTAGPHSTRRLGGDSEKFDIPHYSERLFADGCLENGDLHSAQPFAIKR